MPAARLVGVVVSALAAGGGGGEPPTSFARYAREAWLRAFRLSGAGSIGDVWDRSV